MSTGPSTLGQRIRAEMERDGPLPFARWMELCLYDPDGGFYTAARHPAGPAADRDFATSPTLHPFFAGAVADEVAQAWRNAGKPGTWTVAEFGAGTGSLARDATAALRKARVPVQWVAIDANGAQAVPGDAKDLIRWSPTAPASFDVAVANEFLDALPFDVHEWRGARQGWHRVGVGPGKRKGTFAWALVGESRARLPPGAKVGERRVVMPALPLWLDAVARAGSKAALVVDYGAAGPAASVRAYRGQTHADPLDEPGTVDLTADVDFARLGEVAAGLGFKVEAETQEEFLLRHGVLDALNATERTSVEGASAYLRLRQLLLPTGFGAAFKVVRLTR